MYDDIIHLAMDQQLLTEIRERDSNYKKLPLCRELQKNESTADLEQQLSNDGDLCFEKVFHEPVGYHLMKSFLSSEHSVDKAVFIADVEIFKTLMDPRALQNVSIKIYEQFCAPEDHGQHRRTGQSVFTRHDDEDDEPESKGKCLRPDPLHSISDLHPLPLSFFPFRSRLCAHSHFERVLCTREPLSTDMSLARALHREYEPFCKQHPLQTDYSSGGGRGGAAPSRRRP